MTTRKRPPPFTLVPDAYSTETVECLRTLLADAEKGVLIGVAFAAMYKRRGYRVSACGEAHRSPTYTRGMIRALDDRLAERVRGGYG